MKNIILVALLLSGVMAIVFYAVGTVTSNQGRHPQTLKAGAGEHAVVTELATVGDGSARGGLRRVASESGAPAVSTNTDDHLVVVLALPEGVAFSSAMPQVLIEVQSDDSHAARYVSAVGEYLFQMQGEQKAKTVGVSGTGWVSLVKSVRADELRCVMELAPKVCFVGALFNAKTRDPVRNYSYAFRASIGEAGEEGAEFQAQAKESFTSDGLFCIVPHQQGWKYSLSILSDGYSPKVIGEIKANDGEIVNLGDILLEPDGLEPQDFRVLDEKIGEPVRGATVLCAKTLDVVNHYANLDGVITCVGSTANEILDVAETSESGECSLRIPKQGMCYVVVLARGYAVNETQLPQGKQGMSAVVPILLRKGARLDCNINVAPEFSASYSGVRLEVQGGNLRHQIPIRLSSGSVHHQVICDGLWEGIGEVRLVANVSGLGGGRTVLVEEDVFLSYKTDATVTIDLGYNKQQLDGTVVYPSVVPTEFVEVYWQTLDSQTVSSRTSRVMEEYFSIEKPPSGTLLGAQGWSSGGAVAFSWATVFKAGKNDSESIVIDFSVTTVSGVVQDAAEGEEVVIVPDRGNPLSGIARFTTYVYPDAKGRFSVYGLPAGEYSITAQGRRSMKQVTIVSGKVARVEL